MCTKKVKNFSYLCIIFSGNGTLSLERLSPCEQSTLLSARKKKVFMKDRFRIHKEITFMCGPLCLPLTMLNTSYHFLL